MTTTVVVTDCHYSGTYLGPVIRSSEYFTDTDQAPPHLCLYTAVATFGFQPHRSNPERREDLERVAKEVGGDRLVWREDLPAEMSSCFQLYPDADLVLELDSDEVLSPGLAQHILKCYRDGLLTHDKYRIPTRHLWRSFRHICKGGDHPRLYVRRNPETGPTDWHDLPDAPDIPDVMYHFGYATTQAYQVYKWACSAHQKELRPEWWSEIWGKYPERLTDLHPVAVGLWNAEPFAPFDLPPCMFDHPWLMKAVIA